jgi:hypothetical protein
MTDENVFGKPLDAAMISGNVNFREPAIGRTAVYEQPQPWNPVPPPPDPGYPAPAAVAVTTRYAPLAFMLGLFKPVVAIDGRPVQSAWGRTVVPVPPGQHHVHAHVPYLLPPRVGPADTVVTVHPGQVVEVEYRAPMIAFIGGSIGPAPQKYRGMPAVIALLAVSLVLMLCVCGGLGLAFLSGADTDEPVARPTAPRPVPTLSRTTEPTADPADPADKPTLRSVPARKLVGSTYAAGESTYTMDFVGWPFAFRTPGTWGCMAGKLDLPQAKAWVCIDEGNPGSGQRLQIMLRPCPGSCGTADRKRLDVEWFDPGAKAKTFDDRTSYVETAKDAKGRYTIDMSHYFPAADGTSMWQVGVGAYAPPGARANVQKIINDVFTQTG